MTLVVILIISLLVAFVGAGTVWFGWSAAENLLAIRARSKATEETEEDGESPDKPEATL